MVSPVESLDWQYLGKIAEKAKCNRYEFFTLVKQFYQIKLDDCLDNTHEDSDPFKTIEGIPACKIRGNGTLLNCDHCFKSLWIPSHPDKIVTDPDFKFNATDVVQKVIDVLSRASKEDNQILKIQSDFMVFRNQRHFADCAKANSKRRVNYFLPEKGEAENIGGDFARSFGCLILQNQNPDWNWARLFNKSFRIKAKKRKTKKDEYFRRFKKRVGDRGRTVWSDIDHLLRGKSEESIFPDLNSHQETTLPGPTHHTDMPPLHTVPFHRKLHQE